jgi:hypothetical protein
MMQNTALERSLQTMSAAAARLADAIDHGETDRPVEFRPPLGTVQRRIVALEGMAHDEGMRVEDIARLANRRGGPSTSIVLDTLLRRGIVEPLREDRYRLSAGYRGLPVRSLAPVAAPGEPSTGRSPRR